MCCRLLEKRHFRWFGHSLMGFFPAFIPSFYHRPRSNPWHRLFYWSNTWSVDQLITWLTQIFYISAPTFFFFCLPDLDLSPALPFWNTRFWQQSIPRSLSFHACPRILPFLWSPCFIWGHWVTDFCKAFLEKQPNLTVYPVFGSENKLRLHPLHLAHGD